LLDNTCDEDILHEFVKCNNCDTEPINGPRFRCTVCPDKDLCEACFDLRLSQLGNKKAADDDSLCKDHEFECFEIP
jgi:hypothetical protein